jgi:hypothetical protein
MPSKLPHLSKLMTKILELAGAGAASAAGAFLFGQIAAPIAASQSPTIEQKPVAVQAELVQARQENALLVQKILKDAVHRHDGEATNPNPKAASVVAPKPAKPTSVRREAKAERPVVADSKVRLEELQTPVNRPVVNVVMKGEARDVEPSSVASAAAEASVPASRWRIFGWFAPSSGSNAPRPPMPVGELQARAM